MAGVSGLEPETTVLETVMIAISPYPHTFVKYRIYSFNLKESGFTAFLIVLISAVLTSYFLAFSLCI